MKPEYPIIFKAFPLPALLLLPDAPCFTIADVNSACLKITGKKETNENLQKKAKELAVSNEELEQFAYVASHDLDSRPDGTKDSWENVDLNEPVKEIQILFRRQVEEKSAFIQVDKLPILHSYKGGLREVFQNIISKALKYARKCVSSQIHITARKLKYCWQFSVIDNGMGINEEYFDKIFVVFQRLHDRNEFSGTGVGLALTRNCREPGRKNLESKEEKESTFYFTLFK